MAYPIIQPRTKNITGSDLSGSDATANRTYTIPDSNLLSQGIQIDINGTTLHEGASNDFTMSANEVTFLNIVDNTDVIRINYFISTSTGLLGTDLKYATTMELAKILGIKVDVPSWAIGSAPTNEAVDTGDGTTSVYYLDQKNVLSGSYTIYYAGTAFTEDTHYTLDVDEGKITLTTAGIALANAKAITAKYSYIKNGMSDSYLQQVILRAQAKVDKDTNATFTDGGQTNPAYPSVEEYLLSKGSFDRNYFTKFRPVIDIKSTLASAITASDTSLSVASGDGICYPSSGRIVIGTEIIDYAEISGDTLSGLTRGVNESTAAAHSSGDEVHTVIVETSGTEEGSTPTWNVLSWSDEYALANLDTGNIYIYKVLVLSGVYVDQAIKPDMDVPRRIRINYLYGFNTIPKDITRLCLIYAKQMLVKDNVGKSVLAGRNEFRPEMVDVDQAEINQILDGYRQSAMGNT